MTKDAYVPARVWLNFAPKSELENDVQVSAKPIGVGVCRRALWTSTQLSSRSTDAPVRDRRYE